MDVYSPPWLRISSIPGEEMTPPTPGHFYRQVYSGAIVIVERFEFGRVHLLMGKDHRWFVELEDFHRTFERYYTPEEQLGQ